MPEVTLPAEIGRTTGSRAAGRLRSGGLIPGIVYGHGMDPLPVAVEGRALRAALTTEAGLNALLSLQVGGTSHLTMAREIQRHPVRGTVMHVDFQIVRRDEVLSADVRITVVGEAEEVHRSDGLVEQQLYSLTVNATPDRIPHNIEVDVIAVGLGNPGSEFEGTRHNAGADVVALLAARYGGRLRRGKERALVDEVRVDGYRLALAFPQTYMNESGQSVAPLVRRFGIE